MILCAKHVSSVILGRELGVTEWIFLQGYDAEHDMIGGLNNRGVLVAEILVPRFESNDDYFLSTERNSSIYSRYCIGCGTYEGKKHLSFCKSPRALEILKSYRIFVSVDEVWFYPQIIKALLLVTDSPVVIESTKQELGFFTEKIAESYSKAREADTVVSITKKEEDKNESKEEIICPGCEKIQKDCSNLYGACVRNRPWGRIDEEPREMLMDNSDGNYTHAGKSELDWAKDITKRPVHLIVMVDDNSDPP